MSLKVGRKGYFLATFMALIVFLFIARAWATNASFLELAGYLREDGVEVSVPSDLAFLAQEESTPSVTKGAFELPPAVGRVVKVTVKSGDQVKAGQTVAILDNHLAKARLDLITAQQELISAQKELLEEKLADLWTFYNEISDKEQKLRRTQRTLEAKLKANVAKAELKAEEIKRQFSRKEAELKKAILKVKAAKREVNEAIDTIENKISVVQWQAKKITRLKSIFKRLLDLTKIRAPTSGQVKELKITEGSVLFPAQPIAVISNDLVMKLDVYVPIDKLSSIKEGQDIEVAVAALSDRIFKGKISRVGEKAVFAPSSESSQSLHLIRVVKVQIKIVNKQRLLKAGMSATAYVRSR